MVKQEVCNEGSVFVCESCGFAYSEKDIAQRCEDFCKKHHSCSVEITKHAVKRK